MKDSNNNNNNNNVYSIADFIFEVAPVDYKTMKNIGVNYVCHTNQKPDLYIDISHDEILREQRISNSPYYPGRLHSVAVQRRIAEWLPLHNAFLLHSASFDVDGAGVVFAALSGTGKTTHMKLWKEYLGDRMTIINGDKPFVRFFDDEPNAPYIYGNPWNGKERLGCNMRSKLKHICFIERNRQNTVEQLDANSAVNAILNQVFMPSDSEAMANTIVLINKMISSCKLWKIKCNMEPNAAEITYNSIFCDD